MPIYDQSKRNAMADMVLGLRVDRATAVLPFTTHNLFTIVGGRVLLTGFLGEITVVMDAGASTLQITHLTTVVTAVVTPLTIATASVATLAVGRMVTLPAAVGSALTLSTGSSAALMNAVRYELKVGGLQLVVGGAANTGQMKWSVWYVPVDDGAYMAAA